MTERISFVDEDGILGAMRMPILDRALGAALAFLGAILTLALAPVILAFALPGLAAFQHPFFHGDCGGFLSGVRCGSFRQQ